MKEKFLRATQIIMFGIIIGFIIITFGLGIYTLYTTANIIGKIIISVIIFQIIRFSNIHIYLTGGE